MFVTLALPASFTGATTRSMRAYDWLLYLEVMRGIKWET